MVSDEIDSYRLEILEKAEQLYKLVAPTDEELAQLHDDLKQNPGDYTSSLEEDRYWIAVNVLAGRARAGK